MRSAAEHGAVDGEPATADGPSAPTGHGEVQEASAGARQASEDAQQAKVEAQRASEDAEDAEQGAWRAEAQAEEARDEADAAAEEANRAALQTDALLLDEDAQRVAAQVDEDRPFGVPGRPGNRHGLVRVGFAVTFGGLAALALGAALVVLEHSLELLVIAAFLAIGLEPVVRWLCARGMRRGFAVMVVSIVALGALVGLIAAAVPPIADEVTRLIQQAPGYVHQLQDKSTTLGHLNTQFHIEDDLKSAASKKLTVDGIGGLVSVGTAVLSFVFEVVIVLVLTAYFLADFDRIKKLFYRLVPLERRPRVGLLSDEIIARTGGYILGNVFTSLIAVICQYAVLRLLGVPYALLLSVFVGLLDLIPLVGSTIAGVLVSLVTLATVSLTAAIINVAFTLIYRLVEDYLINPRVLKRTVDVSPVVTVVAVLLGGSLLGGVGALIAVPVAAAVQLILTEVVFPRTDGSAQG